MRTKLAILFSWDETKRNSDIKKHGVTFAEASAEQAKENGVSLSQFIMYKLAR